MKRCLFVLVLCLFASPCLAQAGNPLKLKVLEWSYVPADPGSLNCGEPYHVCNPPSPQEIFLLVEAATTSQKMGYILPKAFLPVVKGRWPLQCLL